MVYGATDISTTTDKIMSSTEALNAVKDADLPTGITLMGTVEPVKPPTTTKKEGNVRVEESDEHKEWFGGGLGGIGGWGGGWGGWGGWGGYGPYRFGYSCGGLGGWAYPLGYWNAFGAGLYGGGCGLGFPYGGLYYC